MDREIRRRLNYGLPVPKRIQAEHAQEDADKNAKESRKPENETRAHANMLRVFRAGGHTSVLRRRKTHAVNAVVQDDSTSRALDSAFASPSR